MLEKLRKERGDEGFTLIELLVVIIIIGILAAIAIPVFLNQRQKGWDAAVQSDLRNAATAQETYLTEGQPGTYTDRYRTAARPRASSSPGPANYTGAPALNGYDRYRQELLHERAVGLGQVVLVRQRDGPWQVRHGGPDRHCRRQRKCVAP